MDMSYSLTHLQLLFRKELQCALLPFLTKAKTQEWLQSK